MKTSNLPNTHKEWEQVYLFVSERKFVLWLIVWISGMLGLWLWNILFLNSLSYMLIQSAIINTSFGAVCAVIVSIIIGWALSISLYFLENSRFRNLFLSLLFAVNLLRSIPQIIGLLFGYVFMTIMILNGMLSTATSQLLWMAFVIGVLCSIEVSDLIKERIEYYRKSDYYHAMLCCGIKESRIINIEILLKSSFSHLFHKIVSLFGVVILLQCSIDFIVSVGLSTDVSLSNFPVTLGSLLAKLDSKQDILALGSMFINPSYIPQILFQHLQGVSIAFIIVFTLLCIHKISDGLVKYYDL